jgi:hypothetical protein
VVHHLMRSRWIAQELIGHEISVFRVRENWALNAGLRDSTRGASISNSICRLLQCRGIPQEHQRRSGQAFRTEFQSLCLESFLGG